MYLHAPTLIFAMTVSTFLLGTLLPMSERQPIPASIHDWVVALWLLFVAFIFTLFQHRLPDALSIAFALTVMSMALAFFLLALSQFENIVLNMSLYLVPVTLMLCTQVIYLTEHDTRTIWSSLIIGSQFSLLVWLIAYRSDKPISGANLLVLASSVLPAIVFQAQFLMYLVNYEFENIALVKSSLQIIALFSVFVFIVAASVGFVLMSREQEETARH